MMTIMYPNYEQYPKYENYDQDQNDWGFFVNLDDLYDHQQLSQNNKYIDNYKKQQKRINYMSPIKEIDGNVEIDIVDDWSSPDPQALRSLGERGNFVASAKEFDEFGWYVPDKLPNKREQMDIESTSKRTKININIEYECDNNNAFMKSCLNTCIVLGISIGCSIFIVLF